MNLLDFNNACCLSVYVDLKHLPGFFFFGGGGGEGGGENQ